MLKLANTDYDRLLGKRTETKRDRNKERKKERKKENKQTLRLSVEG
jgi:hypothetical protein